MIERQFLLIVIWLWALSFFFGCSATRVKPVEPKLVAGAAFRDQVFVLHFETDSSDIGPDQDALIHLEKPMIAGAISIVVEGHADLRGVEAYNRALSDARANAVAGRYTTMLSRITLRSSTTHRNYCMIISGGPFFTAT